MARFLRHDTIVFLMFFNNLWRLINRLDLVHVRQGSLKLGACLELLLSDAKKLAHIDGLPRVAINHTKQTFCGDAIIFSRVVNLTLVRLHLCLQISQSFLR